MFSLALLSCAPTSSHESTGDGKEDLKEFSLSVIAESQRFASQFDKIKTKYKEETGIDVHVSYLIGDGVKSYDMAFGMVQTLNGFINRGEIEEVSGSLREDIENRLGERCLDAFRNDGKFYSFPMGISVDSYFVYDKTVLSQDEVSSWDSILDKVESSGEGKKGAIMSFGPMDYFGAFHANGLDTTFSEKRIENCKGFIKIVQSAVPFP